MKTLKKIALVTCASNFERHGNIIRAMRRRLSALDQYVFCVFTNYGIYADGMDFSQGEPAIYHLLELADIDGCILEANLGSRELAGRITGIMKRRGIPVLTINLKQKDVPCLRLEIKAAGMELFEHLILAHGCSRINLALSSGNTVISESALEIYREALKKHDLTYDERRVLTISVSIQSGRELYDRFDGLGVMGDADAVVCVHDVCAVGLCLEIEARGYHVPEDLRVCSMNCSGNSIAMAPGITGVSRMDEKAAEFACDLMDRMLRGEEIPMENTYLGEVCYLNSCGCDRTASGVSGSSGVFQRLVINKEEAGNQIGRMMQFNNALEEVESLKHLSANMRRMMNGIDCPSFFCCLNENDLSYIESNHPDTKTAEDVPYDDSMVVLSGGSGRTGDLSGTTFPLKEIVPFPLCAGDILIFLPIHYIQRSYGYMIFLNEMLPVDTYHYRICQDSIGSSIENLHREMVLRSSIAELDRLHMQDQLALKRYCDDFVQSPGGYSIALIDIDGLKTINDHFGHLAGNNAIIMIAGVLRDTAGEKDLVIRYGGDEFQILSRETEPAVWEERRRRIDRELRRIAEQQHLPYSLGVSLGYAVSPAGMHMPIEESISLADRRMYENKKERKTQPAV